MRLAPGNPGPTKLPFNHIHPVGLAVDVAGNVYVADSGGKRVLKLAPGATSGNVYVVDLGTNRVLKLEAGASGPIVLPFNSLKDPTSLAVDARGNVYVNDLLHFRILKLAVR